MTAHAQRRVRKERDRLLGEGLVASSGADSAVRPEIQDSWRRCVMTGITPDTDDIPYLPDLPEDSRLRRAAEPVVTRLADQLAHSPATLLLADNTARIVDRRAGSSALLDKLDRANVAAGFTYSEESTGTNGIGTALEERKLFVVKGGEHYRESLQSLACVGTPIVHPIGRRVEGVLDITCNIEDVNDMMAPLVAAAVREIEQRLFEMASRDERALLEGFLRTSRHGSSAVITLSSDVVLANPAATRLIQPSDHALLWSWACLRLGSREEFVGNVQLADSTEVMAKARRLEDGRRTVGIVLELRPNRDREAPRVGAVAEVVPRRTSARRDDAAMSGRGRASQLLDREIGLVVADPGPTLITGAPGTGKRYAARRLHARWSDGGGILERDLSLLDATEVITVLREIAQALHDGFTVMLRNLDTVDDASMTRIIGLIEKASEHGWHLVVTGAEESRCRAYAYFKRRLHVVPLSQRVEELEDIARAILAEHGAAKGVRASVPRLQAAALQALSQRSWPGNVREFASVLCSAASRAVRGDIGIQHLPAGYRVSSATRARTQLERAELDTLLTALEECQGNKSAAADRLGVARSTLYRKVRAYGIDTDRFVTMSD